MGVMASQITSLTIVYPTVYSGADQRKHQSSASLATVRGIYQWPVNSPHKRPVTREMLSFDDVIMLVQHCDWLIVRGLCLAPGAASLRKMSVLQSLNAIFVQHEQSFEQTAKLPMIYNAIMFILGHRNEVTGWTQSSGMDFVKLSRQSQTRSL